MKSRDQMLELRKGISSDVRDLMTVVQDESGKLANMRTNLSNARCEMPSVDPSVRRDLFNIDALLIGVWELQIDGTHRWHILKHWSLGKTDDPGHVLLLKGPSGEYVSMDNATVDMVRQIYRWNTDPRRCIEDMLLQNELKRQKRQDRITDETRQGWKYLRRLFARRAWGTVGNCWERGIEIPWNNKQRALTARVK